MLLTEEELLARLENVEDPFVERKSAKDIKDALKTAVAFANTLPNGDPGVLFMPVKDDGTIQVGENLDKLQMSISEQIKRAYPAILYFQHVIHAKAGDVVAVEIWGSESRPHFAGPSYVRDGSMTRNASESEFQQLVDRRSSKVEELRKWLEKEVTVYTLKDPRVGGERFTHRYDSVVKTVNQWWVTVDMHPKTTAFAMRRVELSFDHERERLSLEITFL